MAPIIAEIMGMTNAQVGLLVGGGALIYTIQRWRKNVVMKSRQAGGQERAAASPAANTRSMREVTGEVQSLLADLEETSRRLTAQLDNRYTKLEVLMAEADRKIARLEALSQGNAGGTEPPVKAATVLPRATESERALQRMRQERGAPTAGEEPAYQGIFTLADKGKSAREIAQELGRQPGEIELILALRQRQGVGK